MTSLRGTGPVPKVTKKKRVKKEVDRRSKGLKECQIQEQCEDFLDSMDIVYLRIPDALGKWIFGKDSRVPSYLQALISSFIKDQPDLTILSKDGKYYCVEIKTVDGRQSEGQKKFEAKVGCENYYLLRSVEALVELVTEKGIK